MSARPRCFACGVCARPRVWRTVGMPFSGPPVAARTVNRSSRRKLGLTPSHRGLYRKPPCAPPPCGDRRRPRRGPAAVRTKALKAAYVPPECLGGALAFRLRQLSTDVRAYRAITVRLAPLSTKPFGVAKPIPAVPPVTTATFPCKLAPDVTRRAAASVSTVLGCRANG